MSGVLPFTATMTTGIGTFSREIDLGGSYLYYGLEISTMTSSTDIAINGSIESGGTFRRIYMKANTMTAAATIPSSVTNAFVPLNSPLPRYVKVEYNTIVTAAESTIRFICWNS